MCVELIKNMTKSIIKKSMLENGYYIFPNAYDKAFCTSAINLIDNFKGPNIELNYSGTEMRIWNSQKLDHLLHKFYDDCNNILSHIYNKKFIASTLLAIRNNPLNKEDRDSYFNRWHIDSFKSQLKIFLFLTDTNEKSGPFEFIPKTHKKFFKLRMLMNGSYFEASNLFSKDKRKYQNLDENVIKKLLLTYEVKPVLCSSGTMLIVDTSQIHRARPCLEMNRYALTAYF